VAGYAEYLNSSSWAQRRLVVLARDGHKCAGCGSAVELHVHHCTYERFGYEPLGDLITLCETCHKAVHRLHRERGGDLAMATAEALAVLRSAGCVSRQARMPRSRPRKARKRKAKPLDAAQVEDARAVADALLAAGVNKAKVRNRLIPELKGQLRKQARDNQA